MSLHAVCLLKATLPTEAKIALTADGRATDERAKPIINPYDEFGIEEAVQLKEAGKVASITLVTVGNAASREPLQRGLAMGADKAVLIDTGADNPFELDGATVAAALAGAIKRAPFDIILCGKVAVDTGAGEVPGRLSELLGIPLLHVAAKLTLDGGKATANREADGRTEVLEAALPAIVSADKSLNKPRYPNLPSIMKAKSKPFEIVPIATILGGTGARTRKTTAYRLPPERGPVRIIPGAGADAVKTLVGALKDEAKAL
jgi:electron transfer flavoprotein beta subunit